VETDNDARVAFTLEACSRSKRGRRATAQLLKEKYFRGRQEDTQEFLQQLLTSTDAPQLHGLVCGVDVPQLICAACKYQRSTASERFTMLSVAIEAHEKVVDTVQEAVDAYLSPFEAGTDFRWRCEECRSTRPPWQVHHIAECCEALVVQLQRGTTSALDRPRKIRVIASRT
jgi:ubiquitin C-terminal hydrolase